MKYTRMILNISDVIPFKLVYLLENEIDEILNEIPEVPGVGKSARKAATYNLLDKLEKDLYSVKLIGDFRKVNNLKKAVLENDRSKISQEYTNLSKHFKGKEKKQIEKTAKSVKSNSKDMLKDIEKSKKLLEKILPDEVDPYVFSIFKRDILEKTKRSFITPNTSIGATSAVALGHPATQLMLNSFHSVGMRSKGGNSFDRINSIFEARSTTDKPISYICFKENTEDLDLNFNEVIHIGKFDKVYNMKKELEEITVRTLLKRPPLIIHKTQLDSMDISEVVEVHEMIYPTKFKTKNFDIALQLDIDPFTMYFYDITMNQIARIIDETQEFTCIWTSTEEFDTKFKGSIFVLYNREEDIDFGTLIRKFQDLENSLGNEGFLVKGIYGIKQIVPVKNNVLDVIESSIKTYDDIYTLYINDIEIRRKSVSYRDLVNLFIDAGFNVETCPDYTKLEIESKTDPLLDIRRRIDESPDLKDKSVIYSIITDGINVNEISRRDDVDLTKFYTNDINQMQNDYGITIARYGIVSEVSDLIGEISKTIIKEHILLVIDTLFLTGTLTGINHQGIKARKQGPLTRFSFDQAKKITVYVSGTGVVDDMSSITASIYTGAKIKAGTGNIESRTSESSIQKSYEDLNMDDVELLNKKSLENVFDDEYIDETTDDESIVMFEDVSSIDDKIARKLII